MRVQAGAERREECPDDHPLTVLEGVGLVAQGTTPNGKTNPRLPTIVAPQRRPCQVVRRDACTSSDQRAIDDQTRNVFWRARARFNSVVGAALRRLPEAQCEACSRSDSLAQQTSDGCAPRRSAGRSLVPDHASDQRSWGKNKGSGNRVAIAIDAPPRIQLETEVRAALA